jgi:hypothetical protein
MAMAPNADVIFIGDDDMRFKKGSTEIINQCCQYMEDNPNCGIILLGGKFGGEGAHHGDEIYIANKGSMGLNRGIMIRNRPVMMDNRFYALGALDEVVICLTAMMQGYYVSRRLNISCIEHDNLGRISEDNPNIDYNLNYIRTKGIRSKIEKVLGKWESREEWPPGIWVEYRIACTMRDKNPVYDLDGSII